MSKFLVGLNIKYIIKIEHVKDEYRYSYLITYLFGNDIKTVEYVDDGYGCAYSMIEKYMSKFEYQK